MAQFMKKPGNFAQHITPLRTTTMVNAGLMLTDIFVITNDVV
ncbi:hypothetical protein [Kovacikia minuta]|nr:hypothetical protein [Kovacikia minuta]